MRTKAHLTLALMALLAGAAEAQQRPIQKADPGRLDATRPSARDPEEKGNAGPLRDRVAPGLGSDAADDPTGDDAAPAPLDAPVEVEDEVVVPEFYGTPRQGLAEVRRIAREGNARGAAALAAELFGRVDPADERLLAELRYAAGVAHVMAIEPGQAAEDFRSASSFTADPALRRDALYNEAVVRIAEGEDFRSRIVEIVLEETGNARGGIAGPDELGLGEDTLPDAKDRFLQARRLLLDRVRMDWRDADARANLEFVQMRLDELAEIEANRTESDTKKSRDEGQESEKTEQGEGAKKGEEQSEEQQEEDGSQGNDPDSEKESVDEAETSPGEGADEGDDMADPKAEEREDEEQPKMEESDSGQDAEELESEQGGAQADREMSKQEARMILDRLNELEDKARRLRAALMKSRMIEVDKDW